MRKTVELIMKPEERPKNEYLHAKFVLNVDLEMIKALSLGGYDFHKNTLGICGGSWGEAENILKEYIEKHFPPDTSKEAVNG